MTRREEREARKQRLQAALDMAMREPIDFAAHPRPWQCEIAFHDGWFFQFVDAAGKPVLGTDDLRDPEDAAYLVRLINHLSGHDYRSTTEATVMIPASIRNHMSLSR